MLIPTVFLHATGSSEVLQVAVHLAASRGAYLNLMTIHMASPISDIRMRLNLMSTGRVGRNKR